MPAWPESSWTTTLSGTRSPPPLAAVPARRGLEKNSETNFVRRFRRSAGHWATSISVVALSNSFDLACFFNSEFHFHTS